MNEHSVQLPHIIQALLLAYRKPLSVQQLQQLLEPEQLDGHEISAALDQLQEQLQAGPLRLHRVASGYRLQICSSYTPYIERLWEERPQRYSRALLETLALVAYRQPVTRGEIEDVRGVTVSSHIIRTLQERDWIKVVGHKEVPGRPALFATTRAFLDYFNLQDLAQLPPLREARDLSAAFERLQENLVQHAEPGRQTDSADTSNEDKETVETPVQELSFSHLLAELEKMESNLKTDFEDLVLQTGDEHDNPGSTGE